MVMNYFLFHFEIFIYEVIWHTFNASYCNINEKTLFPVSFSRRHSQKSRTMWLKLEVFETWTTSFFVFYTENKNRGKSQSLKKTFQVSWEPRNAFFASCSFNLHHNQSKNYQPPKNFHLWCSLILKIV